MTKYFTQVTLTLHNRGAMIQPKSIQSLFLAAILLFSAIMPTAKAAEIRDYLPRCEYEVIHTATFTESELLRARGRSGSSVEVTDEDFEKLFEKVRRTLKETASEHEADSVILHELERDTTRFTDRQSTRIGIKVTAEFITECQEDMTVPRVAAPVNSQGQSQRTVTSSVREGEQIIVDVERIRRQRELRAESDNVSDSGVTPQQLQELHSHSNPEQISALLRNINIHSGGPVDQNAAKPLRDMPALETEADSSMEDAFIYDYWLTVVFRGEELREVILSAQYESAERDRFYRYLEALQIPSTATGIEQTFMSPSWSVGSVSVTEQFFSLDAEFDESDAQEPLTSLRLRLRSN